MGPPADATQGHAGLDERGSGPDDARVIVPEPLRPGDRVRLVAPSGPFDRSLLLRGAGWLRHRYRVEFDWDIFERDGYLAGSDERRLAELGRALDDPGIRAVVAARGGYGLTRIAHRVDWSALCRSPRWLVGFSDVTVLHVEAARVGVASLHAHNMAALGHGDALTRQRWLSVLEDPARPRRFDNLETWSPGRARGPLAGGNLAMLFTCAAAGRLFVPEGAVLAIEDVTESSYRLDRMLTALRVAGAFDRVAAVIVGELTDCPAGPWRVDAHEAVRACLASLRIPVVSGLRFGHCRHNEPLTFGLMAELDADAGVLELSPPATRRRRR